MTRVIHTADTHIGYRQYHSPERRRDFLAAFERVVADAVDEEVDAVVHAGDVFHDRRPDLPDLLGTIGALRELAAADVPFLAIVGNHEAKREAQWLDLFERLDLATRLDAEGTAIGDTTFYGLDHVPRSRRDDLDYEFAAPETEHAALVAHGLFEPFAHAEWDTEALLAEATVDFDAVLLGDNHHPDTAEVDGTWVTYAGSTERVSASEEADRGYNIVEFEDNVDIARRGLPTRAFAFVDVELRDGEGVERVRERVRERDLADAVVYVRVTGDGESFPPATVEEFATERGALVARVNDRREFEAADAELDVSFADPDDAVRERVREMGFSEAALDIDETVRESGVADANVRETVTDRVEALLEDDPAAFEGAAEDTDGATDSADQSAGRDETAGADGATASETGESSDDDAETAEGEPDGNEEPAEAVATSPPAEGPKAAPETEPDEGAATDPPAEEDETTDEEEGTDEDEATADETGGGQASVEDYL